MSINDIYPWILKHYKSWFVCLAAALVLTLLARGFTNVRFVQDIELKSLDYRFVHFPIPARVDTNIVIVDIDNNSLSYFKEQAGIQYPFPRSYYAILTDLFTRAGARAVLFDMLFYDPDLNREETSARQTDGQFAGAIGRNHRVSLGTEFLVDSAKTTPDITRFAAPVAGVPATQKVQYSGALVPIDTLRRAARALGVTNIRTDQDGIVRRVRLFHRYQGKFYPILPLSGWLIGHAQSAPRQAAAFVALNDVKVPMDGQGNYLVNWYGSGGPDGVFTYVTISAAIQTGIALQYGGTPSLNPAIFRGKYVIVGASASGLKDLKPTPFTGDYSYPGMEIWATVLSNLLQRDFVHRVPGWLNFLNALGIAFLTMVIFTRLPLRYSNVSMVGILVYILGVPLWAWHSGRFWMQMTFPAAGFVFSYLYIAIMSFMVEGRSKMELRRIFTRYVHPDVIQNLMEEPDLIQLGGDEIYATVMFTDIYNFTNFSEGKSAPELVGYLNQYFNTLTGFVLDYNGLLDKYTGDGIMAIFGAPIPREDHALSACRAALAYREYGDALRQDGREMKPSDQFHTHTRIGLNTGWIVAGNIGSERRTDYTAIGDDVNLASRLEGVNKVFKTRIILSESTYQLVKDYFIVRELDMLRVKGKVQPVKIYELIADKQAHPDYDYSMVRQYEEGLVEYRLGNWRQAMKIFESLADGAARDPVAGVMYERCKILKKQRLKDWDGVFTLDSK